MCLIHLSMLKSLTKVGFQQKQAELQVKLMAELVNQTLCTREAFSGNVWFGSKT